MAAGPTQTGTSGAGSNPSSDYNQGAQNPSEAKTSEMILHAKIFDKGKVYLGPRKDDAAPSATFHYGDGSYVIQFHYTKSDKAAEKGGKTGSSTQAEDKKLKALLGDYKYGKDANGGIW